MNRQTSFLPLIAPLAIWLCFATAWGQPRFAGAVETQLAVEKLSVTGSVLMIAAHPDDENTAFLAYLARGRKLRTGYLSLTRGEGGQNVIGPEQGRLLGQIRTQELLAARRMDGAEQYFTRAVDFGFSKTAEETLTKWDREGVLGDMVKVIRQFRPDVIVLRFSGTPRDGHGQHQASAMLAKEAFVAAADPKRFPEQLGEAPVWRARRVLWNVFAFTPQQQAEAEKMPNRLEVDTGVYNPLLGYSYEEIAGISRSQHRSQAMGSPERRGSFKQSFVVVAGEPAAVDFLQGVELGWGRIPDGGAAGPLLAKAAAVFRPNDPGPALTALAQARAPVAASKDPIARRKLTELDEALALTANLWADATANQATAAPGEPVRISAQAIARSGSQVILQSVKLEGADGGPSIELKKSLEANKLFTHTVDWKAPSTETKWPIESAEPHPALLCRFVLQIGGQAIELVRPVRFRYVDRVRGELTRAFVLVPPVSVRPSESAILFPSNAAREVLVEVRSYRPNALGEVSLALPGGGWKVDPASRPFKLQATGEQTSLAFRVTPPAGASLVRARAVAKVEGKEYSAALALLDYPHIPQTVVTEQLEATFARANVSVLAKRVGYIVGAGDEVPEALRQMGCEVSEISPEQLSRGDLRGYDAIVTGIRAYNVREDVRAQEQKLLDYVSGGGTLVVQYNVLEGGAIGNDPTVLGRLGPYPLTVGKERVAVEEAPVEILKSGGPLLNSPNRITGEDFGGWVQERGLYYPSAWDSRYETVIASSDPGEKALPGGILWTRFGKGAYVYTSMSWFRQLPAGVPGAYRIFANLLSLGKSK